MKYLSAKESAELRKFYINEYKIKTGKILTCIEKNPPKKRKKYRDNVIKYAAEFFGIPEEKIIAKGRGKEVVQVRQMIARILELQDTTQGSISSRLKQDRTTTNNTIRRFRYLAQTDKNYRDTFAEFKRYCETEADRE